MLTYRKDEIMDLIGSINRVLDSPPPTGTGAGKKKLPTDLEPKRDKMQSELNSIDEELFELEKKYGEYKRPEIKKVVAPAEEEKEDEDTQVEQVANVDDETKDLAKEEAEQVEEEKAPQEE